VGREVCVPNNSLWLANWLKGEQRFWMQSTDLERPIYDTVLCFSTNSHTILSRQFFTKLERLYINLSDTRRKNQHKMNPSVTTECVGFIPDSIYCLVLYTFILTHVKCTWKIWRYIPLEQNFKLLDIIEKGLYTHYIKTLSNS